MRFITKVLTEALDFQNISSFTHSHREEDIYGNFKFEFSDEKENKIEVLYEKVYSKDLPTTFPKDMKNMPGFNLGFTIGGTDEQLFKSNYSYYIKILSTVLKDAIDFINKEQPKFFVVTAFKPSLTSDKKARIYSQLVDKFKHTIPNNYIIKSLDDSDFSGAVLIDKRFLGKIQ